MASQSYITVVDFGSSHLRMLVVKNDEPAEVVAYESVKSDGVSYGVIVDLEKACQNLKLLLSMVQQKIDQRISKIYCSISGDSITPIDSQSIVKIKHKEVSRYDLEALVATAQAIALDNQQVVHTIAQKFKVDNQGGIVDPVGMYGMRLEGEFHLILADQGVCQNFTRCLERVGLQLEAFLFLPIGLAMAVLHQDEMQQGVVLIDMGEGTTDFSVHYEGHVVYSGSIPLGGNSVTRDIAHKLKVDNETAERMKIALSESDIGHVYFEGDVTSDEVLDVISARYLQIFKIIQKQVVTEGLQKYVSRGYVVCGGAARYKNLADFLSHNMGVQCRLGGLIQDDIPHLSQTWLGSVGMVYYAQKRLTGNHVLSHINPCRNAFKMIQRWMEVYF